jgi:hypothetical protein
MYFFMIPPFYLPSPLCRFFHQFVKYGSVFCHICLFAFFCLKCIS